MMEGRAHVLSRTKYSVCAGVVSGGAVQPRSCEVTWTIVNIMDDRCIFRMLMGSYVYLPLLQSLHQTASCTACLHAQPHNRAAAARATPAARGQARSGRRAARLGTFDKPRHRNAQHL